MTTKLYLIRHGITQWNMLGRYCGYKDVNLSKKGAEQAGKLAVGLKDIRFDSIYCSDRKRALQTKNILFGGRKFTRAGELREINFGAIEGLNHDQIMKKYPQAYKAWLNDPYKGRIPEAETLQAFKKRVLGEIKKILALERGKSVAIVCHGGMIAIFISSILKNKKFWSYVPRPASVSVVDYTGNKFKIKQFSKEGS